MIWKKNNQDKNRYDTFLLFVLLIWYGLSLIASNSSILENNNAHTIADAQLLNHTTRLSSSNNSRTVGPCIDNHNGFSIRFPSNWTEWPGGCTFFSPSLGKIFPDRSQAAEYVRITRTNLSIPISSMQELADNVIYFTDKNFYKLYQGPGPLPLSAGSAIQFGFLWNRSDSMFGPPAIALPFVNDSSVLSPLPLGMAQGSTVANKSSSATNSSSLQASPKPSSASLAQGSTVANKSSSATNSSSLQASPKTPPTTTSPKPSSSSIALTPQQTVVIYIINKNKVYAIEYNAPQDHFKDYLPAINEMVNTFKFVTPTFATPNRK